LRRATDQGDRERDAAFRQWRRANDLEATRAAVARAAWLDSLREFATSLQTTEDEVVAAACARIVAALARRL